MAILSVGTDLVDISAFSQQLNLPGSQFRQIFTAREHRRAQQRAAQVSDELDQHLAAVWAMKESFIKAWSGALAGTAPPLDPDQVHWPEIEVHHDAWGCPRIALHGNILDLIVPSLGLGDSSPSEAGISWHVSASHDGNFACALVILERN